MELFEKIIGLRGQGIGRLHSKRWNFRRIYKKAKDNYFFIAERAMGPEMTNDCHLWVSINEEERFAWLASISRNTYYKYKRAGTASSAAKLNKARPEG